MGKMVWAGGKQWLGHSVGVLLLAGTASLAAAADTAEKTKSETAEAIRSSVKAGKLAYRLTTPEELRELLGPASQERKGREGDLETLALEFSEAEAGFARGREMPGPFTLFWLKVQGQPLDIGRGRQIVLRTEEDLKKLDPFWGLADVSLVKLDLRAHFHKGRNSSSGRKR